MPRSTQLTPASLARLERWLAEHHQVVSAAQLVRLAIPRHHAHRQETARRWQRVHRGVWCSYTGPLTHWSKCAAALAALGPDAALDGDTAARLLGFRRAEKAQVIRVVIPHGTRRKSLAGVQVRQSRTLTGRSYVERRGLRVVRIERAALAMALRLPKDVTAIVTEVVQQGLTTSARLRGTALGLGVVKGRRRLLQAIDDAGGGSRSGLEARFIAILRKARLPRPEQNVGLVIDGRRLWLDVCFPDLRLAIEIDGKAYHLFCEDWEDDLERQNDLVLDGWLVLRFSARVIRDRPDLVVRRVAKALEARTSLVAAGWSAGAA
ncbi:MAG TPA: DUF559 domain-containing protein [Mycobacteriales bacterium]|nr:DUF559 domain-containing protein [Mycobacteriales bacterium]